MPAATPCQARWNALDAEAHAFSTLKTGTRRMPTSRSATCPRIISWPASSPAMALPKYATWTRSSGSPASVAASRTAAPARSLSVWSGRLPNGVMPTPAT